MFRVEWRPSALKDLTALWTNSGSGRRRAITAATHAIDQWLQVNPANQGESRASGRRIYFVPPLGVLFRVDSPQSIVHILQVWLF